MYGVCGGVLGCARKSKKGRDDLIWLWDVDARYRRQIDGGFVGDGMENVIVIACYMY